MSEYVVIHDSSGKADAMSAKVNAAIAKGWKPQGGVAVISGPFEVQLIQAMVRSPVDQRGTPND